MDQLVIVMKIKCHDSERDLLDVDLHNNCLYIRICEVKGSLFVS